MANEVETRMGAMLTAIILGEDYPSELNMSRIENILQSIIDDTEYDDPIYSRIEFLLLELKKKMEENPTIEELTVTQNGTYQEEGKAYSPVNVNVEGGPVIAELRVTENGTYEESGKAYSPVIVDVDEGPTIESLSVTANGTYSEEGKAYTPVVVNIEGYKLEDMPTGAIATITDAAALPLNELKVAIEPVQSGSGDPSSQNERPITGWTECNITVADDETTPTISNVYNIEFPSQAGTVYGGTLDVTNGVLTVNKAIVDLEDLHWTYDSSSNRWQSSSLSSVIKIFTTRNGDMISDKWAADITASTGSEYKMFNANGALYFYTTDNVNSPTGNLVYLLATPTTYQLTPTEVKTLLGINNIFADTGDILEGEYFKEL